MAPDSGDDAAALRARVDALEQTVSEQQATIESLASPTASRRGLLKGAAAVAGLGALGIYSSYPASAQAAGQVGTSSEPVDVEAWSLNVQDALAGDLDAGGNDLTNVGSITTERTETTELDGSSQIQSVYVSASGDDSNDGLSGDSPKKTLQAALDKAEQLPVRNPGGVTHQIVLNAGDTFPLSEVLTVDPVFQSHIQFYGGSTTNQPTIDVQTGDDGVIAVNNSKMTIENVILDSTQNAPDRPVRVLEGSVCYIDGTSIITGGTNRQVDARQEARVNVTTDAIIDGGGKGNADGISAHSASFVTMSGTVRNANLGVYGTRNGLVSADGDIDNCTKGMRASDESVFKKVGGTISNCDYALDAGNDAIIKFVSGVTFSGNGTRYLWSEGNGVIIDKDNSLVYNGIGDGLRWRTPGGDDVLILSDTRMRTKGQMFQQDPQDVRNLSGLQGDQAFHDGSGSNTEGPAFHNGTDWVSQVDGSTIS